MSRSNARVLLLPALLLGAACASEQPPVNRVQPNALDKSFFVGEDLASPSDDPEFYAHGTVIDVGYGASQDGLFTSTYAQPLTRIKWVIQEDLLIARLTYERIQDSDGKGAGATSTDGQVVAAYRIQSHFDIQRDYNPSTGEQTNVTGENGFDRPWNERRYMRVDWSNNLNTDAYELDTLSMMGLYGGIQYEPLAYYINDPNHPDAPHFDTGKGYFDVTVKAFARPQMIDLSHFGWGIDKFPACFLDADFSGGSAPVGNCNPVEITIRQSFMRVGDHDYEAAEWDGDRFKAFGAFTTDRTGYARNYGMIDAKWHRLINRYNIWKKSHAVGADGSAIACYTEATTPAGMDPHRDEDADGTEDECAAVGRGSKCDTFARKCTMPLRDREIEPVVWYYSDLSNAEYFDGSDWAAHDWDVAMRSAVIAGRYAECTATGDVDCDTQYPAYKGQFDDEQDAVWLSREVDSCRNGFAYAGQDCIALADQLGEARGFTAGVIAVAKMDELVVLCHSPVEAGDPAACAGTRLPAGITAAMCAAKELTTDVEAACKQATRVRMGDLRYHHVNVITTPQTPSPWGIMVDSHDPLTGEKVAASINVWSHVNDLWSQGIIDMSRYIKGELKTEEITEGTYIRDWAAAAEAASGTGASAGHMNRDERDQRVASFLGINAEELRRLDGKVEKLEPAVRQKLNALEKKVRAIRADSMVPSAVEAEYQSRKASIAGTELEASLATKAMQELNGISGITSSATSMASPFGPLSIDASLKLKKKREQVLAERGACIMHEAPAPIGIAMIAGLLEDKFGKFNPADSKQVQLARAERMRKWLAQRAHYAVMVHEMGHSIALRHNFVSSSDAWGYRPQYWQLRTNDGKVTTPCTNLVSDGASCVGPRWFDPITENEKKNLIWMFQQSSVMDYAGETAQDLVGLGAYDFAAARMFYGDVVSVHANSKYKANRPLGQGMVEKADEFGGLLGWKYYVGAGNSQETIHYAQLQNSYELIQDCKEVDPALFKPAVWDDNSLGAYIPLVDAGLVQVDGKYTRCRQQPVDYVRWTLMKDGEASQPKKNVIDPANRTRVPYGFATDRWADLGNVSVYRHDNGPDGYELFDFFIGQQEMMHVFDNYRRGRQTFSVRSAAQRTLGRFNEKMRDGAKGIGLLVNIYKDFSIEQGLDFEALWPMFVRQSFADNIMASGLAFDQFARQLQRPQAGEHYLASDGVVRSMEDAYGNHTAAVTIPNGATGMFGNIAYGGKPLENRLATDKGEYDAEYTIQAGSYYDKVYVTMLLTESADNFISSSRNDFLDARFRSVSMADVFPDGFRRWLANNLTGDDFIKGPRIAATAQGKPAVDAQGYSAQSIGWTSWWPAEGPQTCFQVADAITCGTAPANTLAIDPQVGFEQQKFMIAMTMMYLMENQQTYWKNQMRVWEYGSNSTPEVEARIEFHDPVGKAYIARTSGKETIFGRTVQKGVGARVLEYANELLAEAYETTDGPDLDGDGKADWYLPKLYNGMPRVKYDPAIAGLNEMGRRQAGGREGCDETDNSQCTCSSNRACMKLSSYSAIPRYLYLWTERWEYFRPVMKGVY